MAWTELPTWLAGEMVLSGYQRQAMAALEDGLVRGTTRIGVVVGPRGVGKSAMVGSFAHRHRDFFAGGVAAVLPDVNLQRMLGDALRRGAPSLLVIDEAHQFTSQELRSELESLFASWDELRVLVISNGLLAEVDPTEARVELGPLSRQEVEGALGVDLDAESFATFQQWLGGRPPTSRELVLAIRAGALSGHEVEAAELFDAAVILGPDGRPLDETETTTVELEVKSKAGELYELVQRDPELLRAVNPREFEEIVAEYLARDGYEVTLTAQSRDGGKDIYAARKDTLGSFLYVIECKAYAPSERVGVRLVRHLYGVVQHERATAGILATTSYFTKQAIAFQEEVPFHLTLRDYDNVVTWLTRSEAQQGS